VPRSDDPDHHIPGRGDTDVLIFIDIFNTEFDSDLLTVGVIESDAVHRTRSVQRLVADSKADPNPNPTAVAPAKPDRVADTTTALYHALARKRQARLPGNGFGLQFHPRQSRQYRLY
jgi:hypothetical protein